MIISSGMRLTPARLSIPVGQALVSFTSLSSFDVVVSFGFTFSAAPRVGCNIASSSSTTTNWTAKAFNVTTTAFTLRVSGPSAQTWSGVPVQWWAIP